MVILRTRKGTMFQQKVDAVWSVEDDGQEDGRQGVDVLPGIKVSVGQPRASGLLVDRLHMWRHVVVHQYDVRDVRVFIGRFSHSAAAGTRFIKCPSETR